MPFSFKQINLTDIDQQDLSFVVSFGFDLARLKASVQELGLLSPPLLRRRQDGKFQIICGYQRILVLAQLGWPELPARLVPEEKPAVWCLQASLQDNISGRGFNPMEAAFMIARLLQYLPEDIIRDKISAPFGPPPVPSTISEGACFIHSGNSRGRSWWPIIVSARRRGLW